MGDYSAAVLACTYDRAGCLELLLDAGADPNQIDAFGWTLAHHCASESSANALKVLLKLRSVIVDKENKEGYTPCMIACLKSNASLITALVEAGANPAKKHKRTKESSYDLVSTSEARTAIADGIMLNEKRLKSLAEEEEERRRIELSYSGHSGDINIEESEQPTHSSA